MEILSILSALLFGSIFGFVLQKGKVSKFNVIVRQFLLKDFTVAVIMLYAIAIGISFFYTIKPYNLVDIPVRESSMLAAAIGGAIFGIGMTIFGYCPGTGVAALGQGSLDVISGILGMITGAAVFEIFYPFFEANVMSKYIAGVIVMPNYLLILVVVILLSIAPVLNGFCSKN
ncbi:hypothetical protein A3F66_04560 [candidate division TM6 bacterium RIFCSPHIGHO2_12_FULL_32_22]|nr:MAG: hypothetical protein A3F66_04560 [candidate division TM6 bacterium RIFCSPHIGHO2_12_FULL_32_22]